jgi:hypothetical protein
MDAVAMEYMVSPRVVYRNMDACYTRCAPTREGGVAMFDISKITDDQATAVAFKFLDLLLCTAGLDDRDIDGCLGRMKKGLSPDNYGPRNHLSMNMMDEAREEVQDIINQTALWLANLEHSGNLSGEAMVIATEIVDHSAKLLQAIDEAAIQAEIDGALCDG